MKSGSDAMPLFLLDDLLRVKHNVMMWNYENHRVSDRTVQKFRGCCGTPTNSSIVHDRIYIFFFWLFFVTISAQFFQFISVGSWLWKRPAIETADLWRIPLSTSWSGVSLTENETKANCFQTSATQTQGPAPDSQITQTCHSRFGQLYCKGISSRWKWTYERFIASLQRWV